MPHNLEKCGPTDAPPTIVTLRHRCNCVGREVLTLSYVVPDDMTEDQFVYAMKFLYQDLKIEVRQHMEKAR